MKNQPLKAGLELRLYLDFRKLVGRCALDYRFQCGGILLAVAAWTAALVHEDHRDGAIGLAATPPMEPLAATPQFTGNRQFDWLEYRCADTQAKQCCCAKTI